MPSKGLKSLAKFANQRPKKENKNGENSKQLTISKFFAFPVDKKDDLKRDEVQIIIDDDQAESLKRKRSEEKVSSPFKKKQRYSQQDGTSQENDQVTSKSEQGTDETTEAAKSRVKDKLKAFEATECPLGNQDIDSFDINILKRDRLASLPDINLKENTPTPSTSTLNDTVDEDKNCETNINATVDNGAKEIEFQKHSQGKGKAAKGKATKGGPSKEPVSSKAGNDRAPVSKVKYTQLEQQVVEIKEKYPDAVLFVECGYKYRFFGKDAEIAASVLKIFCHQDHNFMTASIPTHRLFVHLRRIVAAGYKVGVVKQTETAALKAAGSNKRTPFTRQLSAMYTKSTLIDEDTNSGVDRVASDSSVQTSNTYLVCISDHITDKNSKRNQIGLLAVQPSTGDIIYDSFEDNDSCSELETRLAHIQPVEVLLSENASAATCKLVRNLATVSHTEEDRLRIERLDDTVYDHNNAVKTLSKFYQGKDMGQDLDSTVLQEILNLPKPVLCCMSALITYLTDFKLEKILAEFSNFRQFSLKSTFMQLNKECLKNLEVFQNSTDGKESGSLFWALNQTLTKPGARLLRTWLSQPLLSHKDIMSRQSAISDILDDKLNDTPRLTGILGKLPDLEKTLTSIYHKKCSCLQVYSMLRHLECLHDEFKVQQRLVENEGHVTSTLLKDILTQIPDLLANVRDFKSALVEKAALGNDKTKLFADESQFPAVQLCKTEMDQVCTDIHGHRREVRLTIRQPSLEYTTVLGTEFLVEVKNQHTSLVPDSWVKISSTKAVSRFHSPFIVEKYARLQQLREQLVIECDLAWQQFLHDLSEYYQRLKKAILLISTLDCLLSLATVAQMHGYSRPEVCEDSVCIEVTGGRHPVIQELIGQSKQYVANDTNLNADSERVMIITGPNMGGKSCYIKQVALLTILAQIGSYVPAQSAKLGIFDAVYTRMGAEDLIYKGQSTFMVELSEVSNIMVKATSRSLVILDELGRGTSTHDGVAIAYSALDYFINQPRCLTLFVTHYPLLAEIESSYQDVVGNFHMSFLLNDAIDEESPEDKITFLYQLVRGMAGKSYGLNVACLANVPADIVELATVKSRELEYAVQNKRKWISLFKKLFACDAEEIQDVLSEIRELT